MSTSVLYSALGIRGYKHQSMKRQDGMIAIRMRHDGSKLVCPGCSGTNIIKRGTLARSWTAPPIGMVPVTVFANVPRLQCRDCKTTRCVKVPFADQRRSYTRSFERLVLCLRQSMTLKDVAAHLKVSDWLIRDIDKRWLGKHFSKPRLKDLRHISIDEISVRKNHKYLTIVMDLETGAVVFVGDGKGADALKPFWIRLRASHAKVEAVAIDMSSAYIKAVTENRPDAAIVFDWFHIVKLLNEKLTELRRQLYHEATKFEKGVLKGIRWLILKRRENLNENAKSGNEHERLQAALELNASLSTAYYLKEELPLIFKEPNKRAAGRYLDDWAARARASGIKVLQTFANTLLGYRSGVLAWFDHPISSGPMEGTNNKIKTMKRQAYGFRDLEYFKLRILALHTTTYKLIG